MAAPEKQTVPARGRWVLAGWGLLAGALAALGLCAAGAGPAVVWLALGGGGAAGVWLWCWAAKLTASAAADRIQVSRGRFFGSTHRAPCACVRGALTVTTPALRRAGCCVLVLLVPGRPLLLPGLARADARRLEETALAEDPGGERR